MFGQCPGSANLRTPTLSMKKCPECGHEVEVFSSDIKVPCDNCGFVVYNEVSGCVRWCKHARECLGEEMYKKIMEER